MRTAALAALALFLLTATAHAQTPPQAPAMGSGRNSGVVITITTLDLATGEYEKLHLDPNAPKAGDGRFAALQAAAAAAHLPMPVTHYPNVSVAMNASGIVPVDVGLDLRPPDAGPRSHSTRMQGPGDTMNLQVSPEPQPGDKTSVRFHFVAPPETLATSAGDPFAAPAPAAASSASPSVTQTLSTTTINLSLLHRLVFGSGDTHFIGMVSVDTGPSRLFYATVRLFTASAGPVPTTTAPTPAPPATALKQVSIAVTTLDLAPGAVGKMHLDPGGTPAAPGSFDKLRAAAAKYHVALATTLYQPVIVAMDTAGLVTVDQVFPKTPPGGLVHPQTAQTPRRGDTFRLKITPTAAPDGKIDVAFSIARQVDFVQHPMASPPPSPDTTRWAITRLTLAAAREMTPGETGYIGQVETKGGPYRLLFATLNLLPKPKG